MSIHWANKTAKPNQFKYFFKFFFLIYWNINARDILITALQPILLLVEKFWYNKAVMVMLSS